MNSSKQSENPYLSARREWNERYGDYISTAKNWRLIAFLAVSISIFAVIGLIYIGSQNKFVPYIVAVDKLGTMLSIKPAQRVQVTDERIIKATLAKFIINFRGIITDTTAQKQAVNDIYAFLAVGDPATNHISDYFKKGHSPFERSKKETVTVEISSILPVSQKTWQIEWQEIVYDRKGLQKEKIRMKAIVTIAIHPSDTEESIIRNPMGLYIKDISWAPQF